MERIFFPGPIEQNAAHIESERHRAEAEMKLRGEVLQEMSEVLPESLQLIASDLTRQYSAEYQTYVGDAPPRISVAYIPIGRLSELARICKEATSPGFYDEFSRTVVIIDDPQVPDAAKARILRHEFSHAYAHSSRHLYRRHSSNKSDDNPQYALGSARIGLDIFTSSKHVGGALEEFYAVSRELEFSNDPMYLELFGEEERELQQKIQSAVQQQKILPEEAPFTYAVATRNGNEVYAQSPYRSLYIVFQKVFAPLPEGLELLKRAHYTGNHGPIQKCVDTYWGTGFYSYLCHDHNKSAEFLLRVNSMVQMTPELRQPILDRLNVIRKHMD